MQPAIKESSDAPVHQRRAHKRYDYAVPCLIQREDRTLSATSLNISAGGASLKVEGIAPIAVGKTVTLVIESYQPINAVVRWCEGSVCGFQFLSSVQGHAEMASLIADLESGAKG